VGCTGAKAGPAPKLETGAAAALAIAGAGTAALPCAPFDVLSGCAAGEGAAAAGEGAAAAGEGAAASGAEAASSGAAAACEGADACEGDTAPAILACS
jgi:hypothetical protein